MLLCMHVAAGISFLKLSAQRPHVFGFTSVQLQRWDRVIATRGRVLVRYQRPSPGSVEQVSVSGNFGGVFTVHGIGTTTSSRSDELINITTNRALSFTAANFTVLYSGGSPANTAGSITYEMQLYAGTSTSVGAPLTGAVNGTDSGFDGATLVLGSGSIPSGGAVVLRLSRTLYLTQVAEGATTYTASGAIDLSIN